MNLNNLSYAAVDIRDTFISLLSSQLVFLGTNSLLLIHAPLAVEIPIAGLLATGWITTAGLIGIAYANARMAWAKLG